MTVVEDRQTGGALRPARDETPGRTELCATGIDGDGLPECCFESLIDRRHQCRCDREADHGPA